ncbi:MAG: hypothetical protein F4149_13980 [Gammaproteobacteria bacterium]|nr:hypothetical protein [Gammaproteobacteria bacterium]MYK83978.1 hypothetical protein [Gammaproteobacteria bacterium]
MTPFETEFLAINAAALWVAAAALVAQVVIGAGQIAVVWHGIRSMIASGQARACEHDQRHEEAMRKYDQRHEETMTALRALITRTAPQPGTPNN